MVGEYIISYTVGARSRCWFIKTHLSDHAVCLAMASGDMVRFADVNRSRGFSVLLGHVLLWVS